MRSAPQRVALVALDLDGTVVDHDLQVSAHVIDAIARAKAQGIVTTVVTGRMYRAAKPFAELLGIDGPIVCYQGAGIYDAISGNELRHTPLSGAIALQVVQYAKQHDLHVQLYADDSFYVEKTSRFSELYAYVSGLNPEVVPSLRDRFSNADSTKAVIVVDANDADRIAADLRAMLGDQAYVTRSNPEFVEVLAAGVNKGDALRFVANALGIDMAETIGVGDSWNDIPLLHAAAFGIAMGSAPEAARAASDAVVADVKHDGVLEAYERYVFPASPQTVCT